MFSIGFMTWGAEGVLLRGLARYGTVGTGFGAGAGAGAAGTGTGTGTGTVRVWYGYGTGTVRVRYGDGMAKWHIDAYCPTSKMPIEHCS